MGLLAVNQEVNVLGKKGTIRELRRQEAPFSGLCLVEYPEKVEKYWVSADQCLDDEEEAARVYANTFQMRNPQAAPISPEEARVASLRAKKAKLEAAIEAKKLEAEIAALEASSNPQ